MLNRHFPFAVRLIGFSSQESDIIDANFEVEQGKGYGYSCLEEDNLQDPDLYIANADEWRALAILADLRPSPVRPALLIGKPEADLSYPCVDRPIDWPRFFEALDDLVEKRADVLSKLEASDIVTVPERRRSSRLDLGLADPSEYERMRTPLPTNGIVLVIDKNSALRDYLAGLTARNNLTVVWVADEQSAVELCRRQFVSIVMINTSMPSIDPYLLCRTIKGNPIKMRVIFLVGKSFIYDQQQARQAGVDGFLNKPVTGRHLTSVLKKFLPFLR